MRLRAPVWLMGMANATFGMYIGFAVISLPQLLAEQHLPEATIATITAIVFSPLCWSFLVSPMLDVRFSRRAYAAGFAVLAAVALTVAVWNVHRLAVVEAALLVGVSAVNLSSNALFGWLASVLPKEDETRVSAWANAANIGGSGVMVIAAGECIQRLALPLAAVLLGVLVLLPALVFAWMPAPGPDRKLAQESFAGFFASWACCWGARGAGGAGDVCAALCVVCAGECDRRAGRSVSRGRAYGESGGRRGDCGFRGWWGALGIRR